MPSWQVPYYYPGQPPVRPLTTQSFIYFWVIWGVIALVFIIIHLYRLCTKLIAHLTPLPEPAESTYKAAHSEDFQTCPICLEDFVEGDRLHWLPCSHVFHAECIDQWIDTSHLQCPVCYTDMKSVQDENTPLLQSQPIAVNEDVQATP